MENQTQIQKAEQNGSPDSLLQLAITKGVDVTQLEKLMALKERYDAQQAEKKFLQAISNFQSECPSLKKNKKVDFQTNAGRVHYSYAPLGDIAEQIKTSLKSNGLSYRWEFSEEQIKEISLTKDGTPVEIDKVKINCTCIISHEDGHCKSSTMSSGLDSSGAKNQIQQRGSTITYLQRYTLIATLGIATADEDMDGRLGGKPDQTKPDQTKPETKPIKQEKQIQFTEEEMDLQILLNNKEKVLSKKELKRAWEILHNQEKASYKKLSEFLKNADSDY